MYFPDRGIISLLSVVDVCSSIEVGIVGNEGMAGLPVFLGVKTSSNLAVVQGSGWAFADSSRNGKKTRRDGRRVRAFGEMVAVLWDQGQNAATVRLEHLWHKLCPEEKDFSLFCTYPKAGFTDFAF